jgi:hypothetical protein
MRKGSTAGALLLVLLLLAAPGAAWATLIGQTITVTFSEAGFEDEVDSVLVGDGPEIVVGDSTSIGGSILNVGELIDVGALSVEFVIRGDGDTHSPGFQKAGFEADAHYVLSGLDFSPFWIGDVSVTTDNIVGVALGSEVLFSDDSLTFIVGTLGVGEIAGAPDLGTVTLDLELIPEPNPGLLLAAALAGLGLVRLLRRTCSAS